MAALISGTPVAQECLLRLASHYTDTLAVRSRRECCFLSAPDIKLPLDIADLGRTALRSSLSDDGTPFYFGLNLPTLAFQQLPMNKKIIALKYIHETIIINPSSHHFQSTIRPPNE